MGRFRFAFVARPPSPLDPLVPLPATVVIVPFASTFRTRCPPASATYRLLAPSNATLEVLTNDALTAGPLSPPYVVPPFPATVVIVPPGLTFRIRLSDVAIYILP